MSVAARREECSSGITAGAQLWGIASGPDGALWFTESGTGKIGRITTAGVITEYSSGLAATASPRNIVAGPDGNLWFSEYGTNQIGKLTL